MYWSSSQSRGLLNAPLDLQQDRSFPVIQLRDLVILEHRICERFFVTLLKSFKQGSDKFSLARGGECVIRLSITLQVSSSAHIVLVDPQRLYTTYPNDNLPSMQAHREGL